MSDAGATTEETLNHNYHIHTNPIGDDYLADTGRCASTGGHWNPFDAPISGLTCVCHFTCIPISFIINITRERKKSF